MIFHNYLCLFNVIHIEIYKYVKQHGAYTLKH